MDVEFVHFEQLAESIWHFTFNKPPGFAFTAGDYVELAIPYKDSELGGRRWMTIASSPHQQELEFITKVPEHPSDYKKALKELALGSIATISPAIGTFHLPRPTSKKILWVAGGVGITPYLSQAKWMKHNAQERDISLLYVAKADEHLYLDTLNDVAHTTTLSSLNGLEDLKAHAEDYSERQIFLSGPQPFCEQFFTALLQEGLPRNQLQLDYFEGYDQL